jgi:hypothetical protein
MTLLKALNLLLSFLLELAMLAALGLFGFTAWKNALMAWVLGLGLPFLAAILWGIFAAPRSRRRLPQNPRLLFAFVLFSLSGAALYGADHPSAAFDFLLLSAVNLSLAALWKQ